MSQLLAGLVDDAGLFPPAWMSMPEALVRHRASSSPMLSGRFLCPADRVEELLAVLDGPLDVHLIGDASVDLSFAEVSPGQGTGDLPQSRGESQRRRGWIRVRAVELRSGIMDEIPCYVEGIAPSALRGHGVFGKLRCGGARIPSVDEVAAYVSEAARHSVPFKATAGLHAAVRGWESTKDVPHHGYLNLLLAVARSLSGGDVAGVLASTDALALTEEAQGLSADLVTATRWLLHSYGSCDTDRPVNDARQLGLLP